MKRARVVWLTVLLAAAASAPVLAQGPRVKAPIANNPIVEVTGTIGAVRLTLGEGMPSIVVNRVDAKPVAVWLGSMRYLMDQRFSPKVGEAVEVRGYSTKNENQEEEIFAISMRLPASDQILKLRDDFGYPVWGPGGPGCPHCGEASGLSGGNCCGRHRCGHH